MLLVKNINRTQFTESTMKSYCNVTGTCSLLLVQSYSNTTNLSQVGRYSEFLDTACGSDDNFTNASITFGNEFQVSQALFLS